jgi:hypothetical protein
MVSLDTERVRALIDAGRRPDATTAVRGRALEDLVCYVFGQIPGISITRRNAMNEFHTEEIDVALWNDAHPDGLHFLPHIILIESKNWSARVSSIEVSWFASKLQSRGLDFGILVTTEGVTGDPRERSRALSIIAGALRDRRRLVVITASELLACNHTGELVHLIKEKLCDLAVSGTVE